MKELPEDVQACRHRIILSTFPQPSPLEGRQPCSPVINGLLLPRLDQPSLSLVAVGQTRVGRCVRIRIGREHERITVPEVPRLHPRLDLIDRRCSIRFVFFDGGRVVIDVLKTLVFWVGALRSEFVGSSLDQFEFAYARSGFGRILDQQGVIRRSRTPRSRRSDHQPIIPTDRRPFAHDQFPLPRSARSTIQHPHTPILTPLDQIPRDIDQPLPRFPASNGQHFGLLLRFPCPSVFPFPSGIVPGQQYGERGVVFGCVARLERVETDAGVDTGWLGWGSAASGG
ncbi:BZ3500_MvSof-1268-A1-R1_Chr7-2g09483 [Microbotryum saponariae]|uniref:BZ3500_MvSof-1268-A1-R1_Chr7-2g09483 protein n=1 Tax=Microbotryum saponariae TaxID=289078 RepID=A0A2X0NBH3_9BASI|nr:BZ3501_MvSof-1269-A2-R1_Chr7-1g09183 [Microbotryum saponariae]SDA02536.1 BZ3500_MvSof-1268-A1-R1_Chr7-2g09483 [Microbotryum saponariae]